jgi:hypothetical protein
MKRIIAAAARLAGVVFVLGGLVFGARVALAAPEMACSWEPVGKLGECPPGGVFECQQLCDFYGPPEGTYDAYCTTGGCCICLG